MTHQCIMSAEPGPVAHDGVLIIDDDVDLADIVAEVARDSGLRPIVCNDPREAIALVETIRPAIIVTDIVMPEIDGIEIVMWLAKNSFEGRLVMMSGYGPVYLNSAVAYAEAVGKLVVSTLKKPVNLAHLRQVLARA